MTVRICPSVLNANQEELPEEIRRVSGTADFIHLDIMDGVFVPNFTYSFDKAKEIVAESVLPIDLHLMVEDGDIWGPKYAELKDAGVFSVTIHFEAVRDLRSTLQGIGEKGVRRGVALKPATPISAIEGQIDQIDMILIMTVEPGFGGQSFMSEMMPKVRQARDLIRSSGHQITWLQVDGGIALTTIEVAARAGADTFVAGSAVYRDEDPATIVSELRTLAEAVHQ
jgi:ribulose-phosphate 3-epimerase